MARFNNDYPLAPEKIEIKQITLFAYFEEIGFKYNISDGRVRKLVTNLSNKNRYALHH